VKGDRQAFIDPEERGGEPMFPSRDVGAELFADSRDLAGRRDGIGKFAHLFAIDPEGHLQGFGAGRPRAAQQAGDVVVALHGKTMYHMKRTGQAQSGEVVIRLDARRGVEIDEPGLVFDHGGRHRWGAVERGARDLFGRRDILLHQRWRHREDVADIVEAVAAVVGREVGGRLEVHAQEVTDGIVVLRAIEATRGDAARIGLGLAVQAGEFV
jgi:hypothetical protein